MQTIKQATAGLVLALALPALAQTTRPKGFPPARGQVPAATPAPQQKQAGKAGFTDEQWSALGAVWSSTQLQAGVGDLAAARGASDEVKKFAEWIGNENKALAKEMSARLQERGTNPSALPAPPTRPQLDADAKQLGSKSGDDFDRALVSFIKQHGEQFVDDLKRARDVTEGHDPGLKSFLDHAEDQAEGYLARARQLDATRVQARTPPR